MDPWPHQISSVEKCLAAFQRVKRLALTVPTGGGKTWIMQELARRFLDQGKRVVVYTDKRALIEQTSSKMMDMGLYHGVRADGYDDERDHRFQISSIQTEDARVRRAKKWELHQADLALFDEGHLMNNPRARSIMDAHLAAGAVYLLVTATPIGIGDIIDDIIVGARMSDLRQCGATCLSQHFGPDEPDFRKFKKLKNDQDPSSISERELAKAMPAPAIFGRIWEWFNRLNPERRPSVCFGPSLEGDLWIVQQFNQRGVNSAHVDGEHIWVDGELHKTTDALRNEVLNDSRKGRIVVLGNRFVLREGIDAHWIKHGIFATIFGSLQTYLQSGGRLLRYYPGAGDAVIQDHGGNWWRWGSLNDERMWFKGMTDNMAYSIRAEKLREGTMKKPWRCSACGKINLAGRCLCGFVFDRTLTPRPVVSTDGTMTNLNAEIFAKRRVSPPTPQAVKKWIQMYHRAKSARWNATFQQAMAVYAKENFWRYPDKSWPLMPRDTIDFFLRVSDVPSERLNPM